MDQIKVGTKLVRRLGNQEEHGTVVKVLSAIEFDVSVQHTSGPYRDTWELNDVQLSERPDASKIITEAVDQATSAFAPTSVVHLATKEYTIHIKEKEVDEFIQRIRDQQAVSGDASFQVEVSLTHEILGSITDEFLRGEFRA